jgi:signal transduction histidine kinase
LSIILSFNNYLHTFIKTFILKTLTYFCILTLPLFIFSQETSLESKVEALKIEVSNAKQGEKLKLLDSLYKLTYEKREFHYDSILRMYIDYAYEIDSTNLALRRTSDLVFFYANRIANPEEGAKVFDSFEARDIVIDDYKLLSQLYRNGGDSYYFSGKVEESETLYEKAETYALNDNDSIAYALARTYKSAIYSMAGDYVSSSKLLSETAQVFQREKDTAYLLYARSELATLYSKIGFLEEAKKERDEIIAIGNHRHKNKDLVSISHQSLVSNLYNAALEQNIAGNQKQRIAYLKEAYKHVTEPNYKLGLSPIIHYGLLSAYSENDSLTKATAFFNKIQNTYAKENPIPFENLYRTGLANHYIAIKDYNKALEEAKWVLEYHKKRTGNAWGVYHMDERLSRIYKALGNTDASYKHYVDFVTLRDSINSVKKGQALSYYQTLYETEKRDFKISEQQSEITVLDQENEIKKQWILFGGIGLLALFTIFYLYRRNIFVKRKQKLQQDFSRDLIKEQEKERTRLAMELHDSVGQKLMLLTKKSKETNNDTMETLAAGTLEELRTISRGLHPAVLNRFGFSKAISALVDEIDNNSDIIFTLDLQDVDNYISKDASIHLYRIIQESLNNIIKHSKAKAVTIDVEKRGTNIDTKIYDNGLGFDVSEAIDNTKSLGMKTLIERAKIIGSKMHIDSIINKGTTIHIKTPIQNG